jgi:hypothetical protein
MFWLFVYWLFMNTIKIKPCPIPKFSLQPKQFPSSLTCLFVLINSNRNTYCNLFFSNNKIRFKLEKENRNWFEKSNRLPTPWGTFFDEAITNEISISFDIIMCHISSSIYLWKFVWLAVCLFVWCVHKSYTNRHGVGDVISLITSIYLRLISHCWELVAD